MLVGKTMIVGVYIGWYIYVKIEELPRRAGLVLVGMAGGLQTSWTCAWPHLTLLYLHHYFPDLVTRLVSWLGPRIVANMGTKYGAADTQ